jgi:TRAPP trafficking subunit Trs65
MFGSGEFYRISRTTSHTDNQCRPLAASACYETVIKFLPLVAGVLHLESLRLVDLTTQDATDIREVPDIVAVEKVTLS